MNEFTQLIKNAKEQYNKVIIVNEENSEKYKSYCKEHNIPIHNLSVKIAELLKNVPDEERDQETADKLREWFYQIDDEVIAFDNLDYLFSDEVGKINPIQFFNYKTRKKGAVVILFIRAKRRNNLLIYSEEGKPDYMELDISSNEGFVEGWQQ
ncbi:MAG: BREX-3 system P-loop-containing protein BrxF [Nanoarchaeota archaeon]|nr:BREX-3 system P-loop-containing protein BrxF [Nanoarchaeota archaeon]